MEIEIQTSTFLLLQATLCLCFCRRAQIADVPLPPSGQRSPRNPPLRTAATATDGVECYGGTTTAANGEGKGGGESGRLVLVEEAYYRMSWAMAKVYVYRKE